MFSFISYSIAISKKPRASSLRSSSDADSIVGTADIAEQCQQTAPIPRRCVQLLAALKASAFQREADLVYGTAAFTPLN